MKKIQKKILKTTTIQLKPLSVSDYSIEYLDWLNNEKINRYLETRWEKQTEKKIKTFIRGMEVANDSILYGIIFQNIHVGNIKIGPIDWNHNNAEIGYFIGSANYTGKGLATEALGRVTKFAFEDLGLNKCLAGSYSGNVNSIKVLQKVGFTLEGVLKNSLTGPEGFEDHLLYGYERKDFLKSNLKTDST
tara:strand:- start:282 stop:851 length:570 start_codon:yes stop_codon:yes gene_type:complete